MFRIFILTEDALVSKSFRLIFILYKSVALG